MRFPTCTVTKGVFAQCGQITQVDAIYNNCPGRAYGEIKFSALQSEQGGIVGTYMGRTAASHSAATSAGCGSGNSGRVEMK
jgi:hypothetical protein